jgi:hypothetical protein
MLTEISQMVGQRFAYRAKLKPAACEVCQERETLSIQAGKALIAVVGPVASLIRLASYTLLRSGSAGASSGRLSCLLLQVWVELHKGTKTAV